MRYLALRTALRRPARALAMSAGVLALALLPALLPAGAGAGVARADEAPTTTKRWKYALVYYMNYDNNLEPCGRPILDMLGRGVVSDDVVVTCQADFTDREGLRRYVLTKGKEEVERLAGEDSAATSTLRDYLAWVRDRFPAERYAVIFLDHGGRLGEMSSDEKPEQPDGPKWLEVVETAKACAEWRRTLQGSVELLFLQQCGKGTLENYHAFRETAKVVMGSQTIVGAPNTYYEAVLKAVCAEPTLDGEALATKIREGDAPNMFTTYTTVREAALAELPARLEPVLAPLLAREQLALPARLRPCFDMAPDEVFYDAKALLEGLYAANELDAAPLADLFAWLERELLAGHRVSPRRVDVGGTWCGLSIFVPLSAQARARYPHYPIFQETKLDELMARFGQTLVEAVRARRRAQPGAQPGEQPGAQPGGGRRRPRGEGRRPREGTDPI